MNRINQEFTARLQVGPMGSPKGFDSVDCNLRMILGALDILGIVGVGVVVGFLIVGL
jgi:hypothetical protein